MCHRPFRMMLIMHFHIFSVSRYYCLLKVRSYWSANILKLSAREHINSYILDYNIANSHCLPKIIIVVHKHMAIVCNRT